MIILITIKALVKPKKNCWKEEKKHPLYLTHTHTDTHTIQKLTSDTFNT